MTAQAESVFDYYERLKRLRRYVEQNYTEEISLKTAARIAALEETYFSTYFRKKVGVPFSLWLQEYRVLRAIELLHKKNYTITELAYRVGFADLRTFERAFKRAKNMTPVQFKRTVRP